jgi:cytidylate kinase
MLQSVIAIDGPAASGKSTVARLVAQKTAFVYVDTGAMYRAFAWLALAKGVDTSSRQDVKELIKTANFHLEVQHHHLLMQIDEQDPTPHLRMSEVHQKVSTIAQIPELREYLTNQQRMLRLNSPLVMEGRDIGTVVFTDTRFKFFLDAPAEVRNQRRAKEGQQDSLKERDAMDRARSSAPLIKAADAMEIDTSSDTPEHIADFIIKKSQSLGLKLP